MAVHISENVEFQSLHREGIITVLSILKAFPEPLVFSILNRYFYDQDNEIGSLAMEASASPENEEAIPHLFHIIEHGKPPLNIQAIKTLARINNPGFVEKLTSYFSLFTEIEVRHEILRTANEIFPSHERVFQLNRGVLINDVQDELLSTIAAKGLVDAGDFSFLSSYLPRASAYTQREVFLKMLSSKKNGEIQSFLNTTQQLIPGFDKKTLGVYFCVYVAKQPVQRNSAVLGILQKIHRITLMSFLHVLSEKLEHIRSLKNLFRVILLIPYRDSETEALLLRVMKDLIETTRKRFPHTINELNNLMSVRLDVLFKKIKDSQLSTRPGTNKQALITGVLAHILESFLSSDLIVEVQEFFKAEASTDPSQLVGKIKNVLRGESTTDRKGFEACIPLFFEKDRKIRLKVYAFLQKIDPQRKFHIERLVRFVRIVGFLRTESLSKRIGEVLTFSREEKLQNLEESCIATLCMLKARNIALEMRQFLKKPQKQSSLFQTYIYGARFFPPRTTAGLLLKLFSSFGDDSEVKGFIVDSLWNMELSGVENIASELLHLLENASDEASIMKRKIGDSIARYADSTLFHKLIGCTKSNDLEIRIVAIRALTELWKRKTGMQHDLLTNRLYLLLQDSNEDVRLESLLALLELKDDYAEKVLIDWLHQDNEELISRLLYRLKEPLSYTILSGILGLIMSKSLQIQRTLRDVMPSLCRGDYAELIKSTLLGYLPSGRKDSCLTSGERKRSSLKKRECVILHPKIEFQFKREHTQILTVFFVDIAGYTDLSSRVDMSNLMTLLKTYEDIVIPMVGRYNGTVIKKMGDGILATFKHPVNASVSALKIQEQVNRYNSYSVEEERFSVRIGLHTGSVIIKNNDIFGDVVNIASRMEAAAQPGDILITQATYDEIKDFIQCVKLGRFQVKGKKEAITAYSPEEIKRELLLMLETSNGSYAEGVSKADARMFERLRESLFSPCFEFPKRLSHRNGEFRIVREVFTDIAAAVSEISHDYHEEYIFKKYLQERWDEFVINYLNTKDRAGG